MDQWLSEQMLKNVYELKYSNISEKHFLQFWKDFQNKHRNENLFIFTKIRSDSINIWQYLENFGFKLIDTNVKFELKGNMKFELTHKKDIEIRFAEKNHKQVLGKIAKDNFIYSRFHLDPLIDNDIAKKIKYNWVQNYFAGKRGDEMVVALLNNRPIGFLQMMIKKGDLLIDLICVDRVAQGKGIATSMIQFANKNIKCTCIKVGTQIGNIPSIKLYQNLGFILTGSDYVFHYQNQ